LINFKTSSGIPGGTTAKTPKFLRVFFVFKPLFSTEIAIHKFIVMDKRVKVVYEKHSQKISKNGYRNLKLPSL
jgi:hypothetical protein